MFCVSFFSIMNQNTGHKYTVKFLQGKPKIFLTFCQADVEDFPALTGFPRHDLKALV